MYCWDRFGNIAKTTWDFPNWRDVVPCSIWPWVPSIIYYLLHKQIGNVFVLSVCPSAHMCVSLFVQAITFGRVYIETSCLVWWYILTITRSSLSIKVKYWKILIWLPGHQFNLVLQVKGQGHKLGQGHLKFKVLPKSNCMCSTFYWQVEGGPSTEIHSCLFTHFYLLILQVIVRTKLDTQCRI